MGISLLAGLMADVADMMIHLQKTIYSTGEMGTITNAETHSINSLISSTVVPINALIGSFSFLFFSFSFLSLFLFSFSVCLLVFIVFKKLLTLPLSHLNSLSGMLSRLFSCTRFEWHKHLFKYFLFFDLFFLFFLFFFVSFSVSVILSQIN